VSKKSKNHYILKWNFRVETFLLGLRQSFLLGGAPLWSEARKCGGWRRSLEVASKVCLEAEFEYSKYYYSYVNIFYIQNLEAELVVTEAEFVT
jgi:hypothetical protein